jgi:hypothetical protein
MKEIKQDAVFIFITIWYFMLQAVFDRYTLTLTSGDDILHLDLSSLPFFFRPVAPIDNILH